MAPPDGFAALILTHGRADNVLTYDSLRAQGYTGRIVVVVDDLDPQLERYRERFGDELEVFDKRAAARRRSTDTMDNFHDRLGVVLFARNECWEIARRLGLESFAQLDDDYDNWQYRFDGDLHYTQSCKARDLDGVFGALVEFLRCTPTITVCLAQGGDFIGGVDSPRAANVRLLRKAMNTFVCRTDRPFAFRGRINEDVTAYALDGSRGALFVTTTQMSVNQQDTQQQAGGLTGSYLSLGTYAKSFYSVIACPSSVKVSALRGPTFTRIHHAVDWRRAVPKIVRESLRRGV